MVLGIFVEGVGFPSSTTLPLIVGGMLASEFSVLLVLVIVQT